MFIPSLPATSRYGTFARATVSVRSSDSRCAVFLKRVPVERSSALATSTASRSPGPSRLRFAVLLRSAARPLPSRQERSRLGRRLTHGRRRSARGLASYSLERIRRRMRGHGSRQIRVFSSSRAKRRDRTKTLNLCEVFTCLPRCIPSRLRAAPFTPQPEFHPIRDPTTPPSARFLPLIHSAPA